jgi:hypothetical protein
MESAIMQHQVHKSCYRDSQLASFSAPPEFARILALCLTIACTVPAVEPVGLSQMESFERLPYLKDGVQVHYVGSMSKTGDNSDWDWWLYQSNGEWVIFDVKGPGCIYNFVQHRTYDPDLVFKFYFDDETTPRFSIKQTEFGSKAPFVSPLAGYFEMTAGESGRAGGFRIIRSFVPMPFTKSCRITSSKQLVGADPGGWGHVVYHTYATAQGVTTFTGNEDYSKLLNRWNRVGDDPKDTVDNEKMTGSTAVGANATSTILDRVGQGSIAAIKIKTQSFSRSHLQDLRVRITWDNNAAPSVDCPLGAFFANELGYNSIRLLSHGMTTSGDYYTYFPMPFWTAAKIQMVNTNASTAIQLTYEIQVRPSSAIAYPQGACGYFSVKYTSPTAGSGDFDLATVTGHGHMVAGIVTNTSSNGISCEGDVRVAIDNNKTLQVQSDGSESWACWGWGFPKPPQANPSSSYDGLVNAPWSMTRVCTGDWYPFESRLSFSVERAPSTIGTGSGALFYYAIPESSIILTDSLDVGNTVSEQAHAYIITGQTASGSLTSDYLDTRFTNITDDGKAFNESSQFTVSISAKNNGVRLRRRCDQSNAQQRAQVFVGGTLVTERDWYFADWNNGKKWLDSDFEIPSSYTYGKTSLQIRIVYVSAGTKPEWNEYRYWAYTHTGQDAVTTAASPLSPNPISDHALTNARHCAMKIVLIRDNAGQTSVRNRFGSRMYKIDGTPAGRHFSGMVIVKEAY